jgi:hypothetical protein
LQWWEKAVLRNFPIVLAALVIVVVILPRQVAGQEPKSARLVGTVTDVNGDTVGNAKVVLHSRDTGAGQTIVTSENGFFEFDQLSPATPYQISVSAKGFADWKSAAITLDSGQFKILTGVQLHIATEMTQVRVPYDPIEVANEQLKVEEKQHVLGLIPNFYVTYERDPAPLTAKMKFQLALKVATDPVTAAGVALVSASKQAGNTPNYGQGWGAYGERLGATAADGFTDIMIGGAILPSLLHQDPRYFYQGTGSTSSRLRHAMFSPFIARSDRGKWQPNYSSLGGDLAASGIANLYYPASNRRVGPMFGNFAIGTAERIGADIAQEFLVGKLTKRGGHVK